MNRHNSPKWRRFSRSVTRRRKKRVRRNHSSSGIFGRSKLERGSVAAARFSDEFRVRSVAPNELSLLTNYAETQTYLGLLERNIQSRKFIYIDLSGVVRVTIDAILVMLALIRSGITFQKGLPLVKGCCPKNANAQYLIFHSGFYEEIDRNFPKREPHQQKGVIRRKEGFKVQPEVAAEISKKNGEMRVRKRRVSTGSLHDIH